MGVTVAVTRVACNTSTGTQDITTTDLGGLTPKAALFVVTKATSDGSAATHAVLGMGATDGTNQWAIGNMARDAQSSTQCARRAMTDECVMIMVDTGPSVDGEAAFSSWITNGVRIDWGDAPAAAYLLTVVFFAGTDLSVDVGTFTFASTVNTDTDVTSVGFEADAVLFASHANPINDTGYTSFFASFGIALNSSPVRQYSAAITDRHAQATTNINGLTSDDYAISILYNGSNYLAGEIGSFDASGFSCTTRVNNGGGEQIGYLALSFGGAVDFEAGVVATPTSTGNQSITDPGFTPQAVLLGLSRCATLDTVETDQLDAGVFGISVFDEDDEYCNSTQSEAGVGTSDTQSLSDDSVVNLPEGDGTAGHVASFVSFDANGWTWNFSTTDTGSARQWWYFAVEEEAAAGGLSIPVAMRCYRNRRV